MWGEIQTASDGKKFVKNSFSEGKLNHEPDACANLFVFFPPPPQEGSHSGHKKGSIPGSLSLTRGACAKNEIQSHGPGKAVSLIESLLFEVLSPWWSLELAGSLAEIKHV